MLNVIDLKTGDRLLHRQHFISFQKNFFQEEISNN